MNWKTAAGCIGTAAALATVAVCCSSAGRSAHKATPLWRVVLIRRGRPHRSRRTPVVGLFIRARPPCVPETHAQTETGVYAACPSPRQVSPTTDAPRSPRAGQDDPNPDPSWRLHIHPASRRAGRVVAQGCAASARPDPATPFHRSRGQFRTGGSAELVDSMRHYIHALEEIINSMCVVLQPAKEFHATN